MKEDEFSKTALDMIDGYLKLCNKNLEMARNVEENKGSVDHFIALEANAVRWAQTAQLTYIGFQLWSIQQRMEEDPSSAFPTSFDFPPNPKAN